MLDRMLQNVRVCARLTRRRSCDVVWNQMLVRSGCQAAPLCARKPYIYLQTEWGAINVNNQSQPQIGIPKLVEADGSEIGEIFEPASVDRIVANRMQPYAINWSKFAPGAFKVLKSGGTISYFYQGATKDALIAARNLRNAGFKVKVVHAYKLVRGVSGIDTETGAGVEATKP
jgi:hypothetical protein